MSEEDVYKDIISLTKVDRSEGLLTYLHEKRSDSSLPLYFTDIKRQIHSFRE